MTRRTTLQQHCPNTEDHEAHDHSRVLAGVRGHFRVFLRCPGRITCRSITGDPQPPADPFAGIE